METKETQSDNTLSQVLLQLQELKVQVSDIHSEIRLHTISALKFPRHHDLSTTVSSGECSSSGSYSSFLSDLLPPLDIDVHKEVLKEKHKDLMDIDLRTTNILDYLVENKVLQSSEAEAIRNTRSSQGMDTRGSQTRALLFRLQNRDEHGFKHFIVSLEEAYPPLAKRLSDAYRIKLEEGCMDDSNMKCVVCRIKINVKVYEIIDTFYQEKLIDVAVAESILNCENSATQWTKFCEALRASPSFFDCMLEALKEIHFNLSEELEKVVWRSFTCYCRRLKAKARQKQKDYHYCNAEQDCCSTKESTSLKELGSDSYCMGSLTLKHSQRLENTVVDVKKNDSIKDNGATAGMSLKDISRHDKRRKVRRQNYDNVTLDEWSVLH